LLRQGPRQLGAGRAHLVLLASCVVALVSAPAASAAAFSCGPGSDSNGDSCTLTVVDKTHFRIDQPFVADSSYEYSSVMFAPGDGIVIKAGGCVQTGGAGDTWKRYVDPSGDNSGVPNGLYWGWVSIPGAFVAGSSQPVEQVPLSSVIGKTLLVPNISGPTTFTQSQDLILGYVDDELGDNSYSDHDDGTGDQCAYSNDGGPAWVTIAVTHGVAGATGTLPAVRPAPFDLVPQGFDSNFVFLNPVWGWQWNGGNVNLDGSFGACLQNQTASAPCWTQAVTNDLPDSFIYSQLTYCNSGLSGHRNWFPVTYTGSLWWEEYSGPPPFNDDDYNWALRTPIFQRGIVTGSPAGADSDDPVDVKLEHDSEETIDNFDDSAWWQKLHQNVDDDKAVPFPGSFQAQGHDAVAIGLMGLDTTHHPGAPEVHPVWLLAIREASSTFPNPPTDDSWAIFARNWGDEGMCSSLEHYLDRNVITVDLPRPPGVSGSATATLVGDNTFHGHEVQMWPQVHNFAGGVQFTLKLAAPAQHPWAAGEIHLSWQEPPMLAALRDRTVRVLVPPKTSVQGRPGRIPPLRGTAEPGEPEQQLDEVVSHMTAVQKQAAKTVFSALFPPLPKLTIGQGVAAMSSTAPPFPRTPPPISTAPNPRLARRARAQFDALCAATRGHLPTQERLCRRLNQPPVTLLRARAARRGPRGSLIGPVTVTLNAYTTNGTAVTKTQYRLNGSSWRDYTRAFTLGTGTHTISYRSRDASRHVEAVRRKTLIIR
jgi:hypothetical protein